MVSVECETAAASRSASLLLTRLYISSIFNILGLVVDFRQCQPFVGNEYDEDSEKNIQVTVTGGTSGLFIMLTVNMTLIGAEN
jgi:hypothetical protein